MHDITIQDSSHDHHTLNGRIIARPMGRREILAAYRRHKRGLATWEETNRVYWYRGVDAEPFKAALKFAALRGMAVLFALEILLVVGFVAGLWFNLPMYVLTPLTILGGFGFGRLLGGYTRGEWWIY
jgi:hypothetical protein